MQKGGISRDGRRTKGWGSYFRVSYTTHIWLWRFSWLRWRSVCMRQPRLQPLQRAHSCLQCPLLVAMSVASETHYSVDTVEPIYVTDTVTGSTIRSAVSEDVRETAGRPLYVQKIYTEDAGGGTSYSTECLGGGTSYSTERLGGGTSYTTERLGGGTSYVTDGLRGGTSYVSSSHVTEGVRSASEPIYVTEHAAGNSSYVTQGVDPGVKQYTWATVGPHATCNAPGCGRTFTAESMPLHLQHCEHFKAMRTATLPAREGVRSSAVPSHASRSYVTSPTVTSRVSPLRQGSPLRPSGATLVSMQPRAGSTWSHVPQPAHVHAPQYRSYVVPRYDLPKDKYARHEEYDEHFPGVWGREYLGAGPGYGHSGSGVRSTRSSHWDTADVEWEDDEGSRTRWEDDRPPTRWEEERREEPEYETTLPGGVVTKSPPRQRPQQSQLLLAACGVCGKIMTMKELEWHAPLCKKAAKHRERVEDRFWDVPPDQRERLIAAGVLADHDHGNMEKLRRKGLLPSQEYAHGWETRSPAPPTGSQWPAAPPLPEAPAAVYTASPTPSPRAASPLPHPRAGSPVAQPPSPAVVVAAPESPVRPVSPAPAAPVAVPPAPGSPLGPASPILSTQNAPIDTFSLATQTLALTPQVSPRAPPVPPVVVAPAPAPARQLTLKESLPELEALVEFVDKLRGFKPQDAPLRPESPVPNNRRVRIDRCGQGAPR